MLKQQPTGPVSRKWWANGYQEALEDIANALHEGGTERALQWVLDNTWNPQVRAIVKQAQEGQS